MIAHNQTELIVIGEELALYTSATAVIWYGVHELRKDALYGRWQDTEAN